ncbi:TetR family transcriptional regulator C-terminal domain-containing protein [Virgibacillus kekensis]|uniref:TetR family transcriptional regulator C-terminal domain-containing protein n=1 Tax=Virgibacillus kekensis TaxID=202261 RepID=A0ABV9DK32_9BACI
MELVVERVQSRTENKQYDGTPLEVITEAICEVLPVDETRKLEMEVWFAFSAKTLVDSTLGALSNKVYKDMQTGIKKVIGSLQALNLLNENVEMEREVFRLHALVDGMAMHHLLYPEQFSYDNMITTLKYHLESLCKAA